MEGRKRGSSYFVFAVSTRTLIFFHPEKSPGGNFEILSQILHRI
jgi:hypothetical protein